jgi:hypothetical protein
MKNIEVIKKEILICAIISCIAIVVSGAILINVLSHLYLSYPYKYRIEELNP